jgi:tRNA(Ile2) C34 agmatinyltransferase TiaS
MRVVYVLPPGIADLLDQAQTALDLMHAKLIRTQDAPVCPYCCQAMVRAHIQDGDGDWRVCWLCGCKPDEDIEERVARVLE